MQIQAVNELEHVVLVRRIAQTNLEPLRLWLPRFGIADYFKFTRQNVFSSGHSQ
jgi:hypothetical protein